VGDVLKLQQLEVESMRRMQRRLSAADEVTGKTEHRDSARCQQ